MASALDAVLALKANEQAQAQARSDQITQAVQLLSQARQQATENKLRELLVNSQVKNFESESLKNNQLVAMQQKQNDLISGLIGGNNSVGGLQVKGANIGKEGTSISLENPNDLAGQRQERLLKQQNFSNSTKLRQEFINRPEVKDYITVAPNIRAMDSLLNNALKGDIKNAVGLDQGLITMFNKLTDPQSVVRESEYARTPSNLPFVNQFNGALQKIASGGAGMTNDDRKALLQGAKIIANERGKQYQSAMDQYKGTAADYGLDERLITRDMPNFKEWDTKIDSVGSSEIPKFDADKEARYQAWKAKQK